MTTWGHIQHMYSWWWVELSPETCRVKPLRRINAIVASCWMYFTTTHEEVTYNGYRVFPGGEERPGRDADPSSPSSAVVIKGWSYTSTPPMGSTACREPQCLYKGALYLTSVPVQGCTLPYLSACTRVTFTLLLYEEVRIAYHRVGNLDLPDRLHNTFLPTVTLVNSGGVSHFPCKSFFHWTAASCKVTSPSHHSSLRSTVQSVSRKLWLVSSSRRT